VRPDAKITLKDTTRPEGRNTADFFLEADRGTMSGERMEQKIQAYLAYHKQQRYMQTYPGMKMFQVLMVTEARSRARYSKHISLPSSPQDRRGARTTSSHSKILPLKLSSRSPPRKVLGCETALTSK
jgi:hypothetical protein